MTNPNWKAVNIPDSLYNRIIEQMKDQPLDFANISNLVQYAIRFYLDLRMVENKK